MSRLTMPSLWQCDRATEVGEVAMDGRDSPPACPFLQRPAWRRGCAWAVEWAHARYSVRSLLSLRLDVGRRHRRRRVGSQQRAA